MPENSINKELMLRVGTILHGTYRIDRYLSSGGFGNTYVATHIDLDETCAVKEFFMKGVTQRDGNNTTVSVSNREKIQEFEAQREKFKKEARRLRKLNNRHIVRVHDLFEENGTAYYVMDYVDGENLKERMMRTQQPLTEKEVADIIPQVLDALSEVHSKNIWHLDLKPANIMIDHDGTVKLIDFGASKQFDVQKGGATTGTAVSYTNGYAPLEQMEQSYEKFGPWTDFYALGATVYNLLTNQRPPMPTDIDDDRSEDKHLALPLPAEISPKMRQLILWLMKTDRLQRPQKVSDIDLEVSSLVQEPKLKPITVDQDDKTLVLSESGETDGSNGTGDPTIEPTQNAPQINNQSHSIQEVPTTAYLNNGDGGKGHKWFYAILVFILSGIMGGGYWWYCHSDGNHEIRQFVEQFAKAVKTDDSLVIRNLYPDCNVDSLLFNHDINNLQIERTGNEWIVKEGDDVVLIIVKNEDNTIHIKESYGIYSFPDSLLTIAKATGWYDNNLSDKQNAERLSDEDFIIWLKDFIKNKIKANVKISKKSQYIDDNFDNAINVYVKGCDFKCTHTVIISNENNFVIPDKDYYISVIHMSDDDYEYFQENKKRIGGKPIPANGTVSYTWQDIHFVGTWEYADDVMLVYNPSLDNMSELSGFTGTEYEEYKAEKK